MNFVRRMMDGVLDSPTYVRDRANLISGFSIGTTALLLNWLVLAFALPLLMAPSGTVLSRLTDKLEFGQLLALILLGGATVLATFLIPLRLITVFWEPRINRYFDQIVLSGISPLRYVIGKATSQNLFVGMILFLLLPYFVLSLTLGGVNLVIFVACLFLVWLHCISLALVTLWVSLYLNELLAAICVIVVALILSSFGSAPLPYQVCVMTPFPAILHPVYRSMPNVSDMIEDDFFTVFASCGVGICTLICSSLVAIYFGPLYGIIRENSTFGEVVRAGDSIRKRWLRARPHIQRPSEIAFFYQNRSRWFLQSEGLLRWGTGLCGLLVLSIASHQGMVYSMTRYFQLASQTLEPWRIKEFHSLNIIIYGLGLALAMFLFSHAKNTTYMRVPLIGGWSIEISKLDTNAFLLYVLGSTAIAIATPFQFERDVAIPGGFTIFPEGLEQSIVQSQPVNVMRIVMQGTLTLTLTGLVLYAFQRLVCQSTWLRGVSLVAVFALYGVFVCTLPTYIAMITLEMGELRQIPMLVKCVPTLAAISPFSIMLILFGQQPVPLLDKQVSTLPFYVLHGVLLCCALYGIRRNGRRLRQMYLTKSAGEAPHAS